MVLANSKNKSESKVKIISKSTRSKKGLLGIIFAIGGYFKGSWAELRQVRWPNRKATWSLTFAVLVFTMFFVTLIVLLDAAFKYLFDLILK
jgi:preprotein translocase SecE subunit